MSWTADFDPLAMLRVLVGTGVDLVVVGGLAAVLHGSPRVTQDLDIIYADDEANLTVLGRALHTLEARLRGVDSDVRVSFDARLLDNTQLLTLMTVAGPLDLLRAPQGAPTYAQLRSRAERLDVGDLAVLVAAIDDLIAMKQSSGRPKDLADVAELEAIAGLRDE